MKKNQFFTVLLAVLLCAALLALLGGCVKKQAAPEPTGSAGTDEAADALPDPGRADGERYETVITIEGMEETVQYEHIRNEDAGFEMDFDYERFDRRSGPDGMQLVSVYDDPEAPENYLEVTYNAKNAEDVAKAVSAALSKEYEVFQESLALARAGECIHIDASAAADGSGTPDQLQAVYIFPAENGCRVVAAHCGFVESEGFGVRFRDMLNTFAVLPVQGEQKLSEGQALAAIEKYCYLSNPDLKQVADGGEYPVEWSVSAGDDGQIVVLFRSYTGAEIRYYVDPASGDAHVTEFVSGVSLKWKKMSGAA